MTDERLRVLQLKISSGCCDQTDARELLDCVMQQRAELSLVHSAVTKEVVLEEE